MFLKARHELSPSRAAKTSCVKFVGFGYAPVSHAQTSPKLKMGPFPRTDSAGVRAFANLRAATTKRDEPDGRTDRKGGSPVHTRPRLPDFSESAVHRGRVEFRGIVPSCHAHPYLEA